MIQKRQLSSIEFLCVRGIFETKVALCYGELTRLRGSKYVHRCNFSNIFKLKSVIVS